MANKKIYLDFDNTICATGKWHEGPINAEPIPFAKDTIQKLIDQGFECIVFTARIDLFAVKMWLEDFKFPKMEITNTKGPALAYIDDRAIRFTNWDDIGRYFL